MRNEKEKVQHDQVYSVILPGTETPTTTAIHRAPETPDALLDKIPGHDGITTLADVFAYAVATYPTNPHLGHIVATETGGQEFVWQTYSEVHERAVNFGKGLVAKDLIPVVDGMKMLAVLSKNRAEWVIGEQGLMMQGGTAVPLYDSLGPDAIRYALNQTQLSTVLCSRDELLRVVACANGCASFKTVILMDEPTPRDAEEASVQGLKLYSFAEIEDAGAHYDASRDRATPPTGDMVATFCYTSGTTGLPKGAMLTHRNMLSALASAATRGVVLSSSDVHLSYLPLAHVFERQVQYMVMLGGGRCGFYAGSVLTLGADLKLLRPTVFVSVPRVLNKLHGSVMMAASKSALASTLLKSGLRAKISAIKHGRSVNAPHWLWDRLVFKKVARKVGLDRCWLIITASAPIRDDVKTFLRAACSCAVVEGYGQSETAAAGTATCFSDTSSTNVGSPSAACEVMLEAVPDLGYLPSDHLHQDGNATVQCLGRGEICFRGPCIFKEYYKMPKETQEIVDAAGWCHTGDIGIWLPSGQLRIVDRKKNMFKLSQGEYVAAERVESAYLENHNILQVLAYGDSLQSCLVGVVAPDFNFMATCLLPSLDLPEDMPPEDICASDAVKAALLRSMQATGAAEGLRGFEQVKALVLTAEGFTVDNGLMTPTFKLRRHEIKASFRAEIAAAYASVGGA